MVEQDAVAGIDAVGLAVVHGDPVGVQLGRAVGDCADGTAWSRAAASPAPGRTAPRSRPGRSALRLSSPRMRIASSRRSVPSAVGVGGVFGRLEADLRRGSARRDCRSRRAGPAG